MSERDERRVGSEAGVVLPHFPGRFSFFKPSAAPGRWENLFALSDSAATHWSARTYPSFRKNTTTQIPLFPREKQALTPPFSELFNDFLIVELH